MRKTLGPILAALAAVGAMAWLRGGVRPLPFVERRLVMGSLVSIMIAGSEESVAAAASRAAFARMEELDRVASGWRADGLVAALNRDGRLERRAAGPDLLAMLEGALELGRASGGRFDPVLGRLVDAWGFGPGGEPSTPPGRPALAEALAASGAHRLRLGPETIELTDGARVELGGYAAGYAVDAAIAVLAAHRVSALVDHSGDLRATGPKPDGSPWRIGIRDPAGDRSALLGVVGLRDGAITTSGDYEHAFRHAGIDYHHLLDPATGQPGRLWRQVTVRAPTCVLADGWSKPLFLADANEGPILAARHGLEALWIAADGRTVSTPGWNHDPLP